MNEIIGEYETGFRKNGRMDEIFVLKNIQLKRHIT